MWDIKENEKSGWKDFDDKYLCIMYCLAMKSGIFTSDFIKKEHMFIMTSVQFSVCVYCMESS